MNIAELKEILDDYGDHLQVLLEFSDVQIHSEFEVITCSYSDGRVCVILTATGDE